MIYFLGCKESRKTILLLIFRKVRSELILYFSYFFHLLLIFSACLTDFLLLIFFIGSILLELPISMKWLIIVENFNRFEIHLLMSLNFTFRSFILGVSVAQMLTGSLKLRSTALLQGNLVIVDIMSPSLVTEK